MLVEMVGSRLRGNAFWLPLVAVVNSRNLGLIFLIQGEVTHRVVVDDLLLVGPLVEELLRDVAEPAERRVERLLRPREVEHDERPVRVLVVHSGEAPESLVARNIPELDIHQLFANLERERIRFLILRYGP